MPVFRSEHRTLVEMFNPGHKEYSDVLSSLGMFMEKKVLPFSAKLDTGDASIQEPRAELIRQGICQISFPTEYGGLGLPFSVYAMAIEMLGYSDASIALSIEIHNAVAEGLFKFGSEAQKKSYIPRIISGEVLASFSLTEPTSGSDARNMGTTAEEKGKGFSINGSKMFITNAGEADIYLVFAKSPRGPSCFLVEGSSSGLSFGRGLKKLGMRASKTSEVIFSDCKVPATSLVGVEGEGLEYAKQILHGARIVVAALNVGIAQIAYDKALAYAKQRKAFGGSISEFQLIREKIADMKTEINAGRLLYLYASKIREQGMDFSSEASQAKVFATEMSLKVCDAAIQIFGGYGYTTEDVHRHWRDARLLTIGEGTSEVLRMLIARRELARSL